MPRFISQSLLAISLLATAAHAGEAAAPRDDLSPLQGKWVAAVGPQNGIRVELDIQADKARLRVTTPQGLVINARGKLAVDTATTPSTLDWSGFKSLDGQTLPAIPAIYRLDNNRFVVCNGGPNGSRPTAFQSGDGLLASVVVFERPTTSNDQLAAANKTP